jgi:acyl-CoA reductase-like NAD-dependent aldehyde dehydrogenase
MSRQEEMAKLITLENGKPIKEALGEIIYSADYLEVYSEEARRIHVNWMYSKTISICGNEWAT